MNSPPVLGRVATVSLTTRNAQGKDTGSGGGAWRDLPTCKRVGGEDSQRRGRGREKKSRRPLLWFLCLWRCPDVRTYLAFFRGQAMTGKQAENARETDEGRGTESQREEREREEEESCKQNGAWSSQQRGKLGGHLLSSLGAGAMDQPGRGGGRDRRNDPPAFAE